MVDDTTLCSIRSLADYVIENKITHLFDDALVVRKWLDADIVAFGTCPRCKKESMEIHGEGITGDCKHYPMENCLNCGFVSKDFTEYSGSGQKADPRSSEVKGWLLDRLESWDFTFDEETEIPDLMKKIKDDQELTAEEYEEILFHLWQIYYGEE